MVNTVTFEEADGGATTVRIRTDAGSKEVRDMIAQSGMEGGVREQFEIIEELAAALAYVRPFLSNAGPLPAR